MHLNDPTMLTRLTVMSYFRPPESWYAFTQTTFLQFLSTDILILIQSMSGLFSVLTTFVRLQVAGLGETFVTQW